MHGLLATIAANGTSYLVPAINGLVSQNGIPIPIAGTTKNLYVRINGAQNNGLLQIFVQKNVVDTALAVTINPPGGAGTYTNLTDAIAWSAGDVFCLRLKNNNGSGASAPINGVTVEFQTPIS